MIYNDLFHIHTHRCCHAGKETDIDYINKAIELKAKSIYFTDHAPFPNDIFFNRMKMNELNEYVNTLFSLKKEFEKEIQINIGLEIEYIPEFIPFYKYLKENYDIQLFLGQHICVYKKHYNFEYKDKKEEYKWMTNSILEALDINIFSGLMHPERIYRNCHSWDINQVLSAKSIWESSYKKNIPIEYNFSSVNNKNLQNYHKIFWNEKIHNNIVYGIDAHSTEELEKGTYFFRNLQAL